MKLTLLNFLYRISRPTHWVKLNSYSRALDLWLLDQIEKDTFESFGYLTAYIGGKEIWVSNYPYSYGWAYGGSKYHCGSYVAVKLRKYLQSKEFPL